MRAFIFEEYYEKEENDSYDIAMSKLVASGEAEELACELCEHFNGRVCDLLGYKTDGLLGCVVTSDNDDTEGEV